jgi:hypothetical protein
LNQEHKLAQQHGSTSKKTSIFASDKVQEILTAAACAVFCFSFAILSALRVATSMGVSGWSYTIPMSAKTAACLGFLIVGFSICCGLTVGVRLLDTALIVSKRCVYSCVYVPLLSWMYSCDVLIGRFIFVCGGSLYMPFVFFCFFGFESYEILPSSLGTIMVSYLKIKAKD